MGSIAMALSGCREAPTPPPPGNPAAFDAKSKAMNTAAADPKFDTFRAACADYTTTLARRTKLEAKIQAGTASPDELKTWGEMAELLTSERKELLAYIQGEGFTAKDRTTLHWIMNAPPPSSTGG